MKTTAIIIGLIGIGWLMSGCHTTKKVQTIQAAISKKDTASRLIMNKSEQDSIELVKNTMRNLLSRHIDFRTFDAKIKVEYENSEGRQPNTTAYVRILNDSLIWISIYATVFNVEAFRILITKDSVFVLNKIAKEAQLRSLDYLGEVTGIPFDYKTIQDVIVGNPVYLDTSRIVFYKKTGDRVLILTAGTYFKNLLTLSTDSVPVLFHSKLDDINLIRNRTADITYDDYEKRTGVWFSTYREITVSEKNRLDIRLDYKQYEFNKDLPISFNIPKNYSRK